MKYTGKWWDTPHRSEKERYFASGVVKFLYGVILLVGLALLLTSCEKENFNSRILDGEYSVSYKVWEEPYGTKKYYYPIGTDVTGMPITGWMAETKLIFTDDSLGISQLMNEGWSEGYVSLEWMNGVPHRVGCHYVESVTSEQISWYQDDVIIRWYLVKE